MIFVRLRLNSGSMAAHSMHFPHPVPFTVLPRIGEHIWAQPAEHTCELRFVVMDVNHRPIGSGDLISLVLERR